MSDLKLSHEVAWNHDVIIQQGQTEPLLFTLYSGMAIKCREVRPGKTHVVSVVLPGDLVGLDFIYSGVAWSSVQAVTDITFCKFAPERWPELLRSPSLASRVCETLVLDQRDLEDRLAVVSACTGEGALAHFLISLYDRLWARRLCHEDSFSLPLTNRQIADAVGVTTVHLHRVLVKLRGKGILAQDGHRIKIHDISKLREIACMPPRVTERPLL
ncbi:MAG TPA: Crp/Fnr family transcriptional regulator [Allosphingosinicella sp.]|nr:Crp/Fnr family transcriptional regulator [Allosphingosinicella sp.]